MNTEIKMGQLDGLTLSDRVRNGASINITNSDEDWLAYFLPAMNFTLSY
jgi:hypothetical protein